MKVKKIPQLPPKVVERLTPIEQDIYSLLVAGNHVQAKIEVTAAEKEKNNDENGVMLSGRKQPV